MVDRSPGIRYLEPVERGSSPARRARWPRGRDECQKLLSNSEQQLHRGRERVADSVTLLLASKGWKPVPPFDRPERRELRPLLLALLKRSCDLDLLLFFYRHPRTLATIDDLATRVGYRRRRVLASVKVLTQAGFLTCSSAHAGKRGVSPRLYQFHSVLPDRVLSAFCWLAFSPEGRQAMLRALSGQTSST